MFKEYLIQNFATILIIIAFIILLKTTIFLDKKVKIKMFFLIIMIFILSIIVFIEYYYNLENSHKDLRTVLMAIRYSATPFIVAMVLYTLVKKMKYYVFIPALLIAILNIISIFNGMVYSLNDDNQLVRGPLGYLPFIAVGIYSVFLVYILIKQSNKQATEIIPIVFLCIAFLSGLIFPFIFGKDYSQIFCVTIIIALFVYYVFSILQLTNKDSLTGLLNRQAYYASTSSNLRDITGIISIDMNGLKVINDTYGHLAGDEALITISHCFTKAVKLKQPVYRIGGDEFMIVCFKTSLDEIKQLVKNIESNVNETKYSCSIGYSYNEEKNKDFDSMVKESDDMMYKNKALYYENKNKNN